MSWFQAVVLGAVQGATEFLPVSSSAHLLIFRWFFNWNDPGLAFDVILHLGTLIAVIGYFLKDWVRLFSAFFYTSILNKRKNSFENKLFWMIMIGTIPGAIAGFLLEDKVEKNLRYPLWVASFLVIMGFVLFISERFSKKGKVLEKLNWCDAIIIGLAQAIAIAPGVSRAGITLAVGMLRGLRRDTSATFSFLLSMPIIAGAGILEIKNIFPLNLYEIFPLILGFISASIIGLLSIHFLLNYLKTRSVVIFVFYRFLLGISVFIFFLIQH